MYQRIVVGAGPSEAAESAVAEAVDLANALGAELHLVLAFDRFRDRAHPESLPATNEAEDHLARLGTSAAGPVQRHAVPGDPAEAILDTADRVDADLIVVGNKGMRGVGRVIGSVTNTVSHKAACSVLIVSTT
jgi:nucleotide-binding universal stress UspA family protein